MGLSQVTPLAPLAPYIGATPHNCCAAPFVGMGGVFPRRRSRPRGEAIND